MSIVDLLPINPAVSPRVAASIPEPTAAADHGSTAKGARRGGRPEFRGVLAGSLRTRATGTAPSAPDDPTRASQGDPLGAADPRNPCDARFEEPAAETNPPADEDVPAHCDGQTPGNAVASALPGAAHPSQTPTPVDSAVSDSATVAGLGPVPPQLLAALQQNAAGSGLREAAIDSAGALDPQAPELAANDRLEILGVPGAPPGLVAALDRAPAAGEVVSPIQGGPRVPTERGDGDARSAAPHGPPLDRFLIEPDVEEAPALPRVAADHRSQTPEPLPAEFNEASPTVTLPGSTAGSRIPEGSDAHDRGKPADTPLVSAEPHIDDELQAVINAVQEHTRDQPEESYSATPLSGATPEIRQAVNGQWPSEPSAPQDAPAPADSIAEESLTHSVRAVNKTDTEEPAAHPEESAGTGETDRPNHMAGGEPGLRRAIVHEHAGATGSTERPGNTSRILEQVAHAIEVAQRSGNEMHLHLHPPELGALQIDVSVRDGVLTARLDAQVASTRQLLTENLAQLKESLVQQGLRFEQIEVHATGNWRGDGAGTFRGRAFDQQPGQDAEERQTPPGLAREPQPPAAAALAAIRRIRGALAAIDITV